MTPGLTGALLGLLLGGGVLVTVNALPPLRRPRLEDRLAPYLRDTPRPSRLLATDGAVVPMAGTPLGVLARLLRPALADAARWVERLAGGTRSVGRRLGALGGGQTVEEFRMEQVLCGTTGLLGGLLAAAAYATVLGRFDVLSTLLLGLAGLVAGVLGRDWWLSHRVRRHEEQLTAEFPVVAELLALAVTAGEGPSGALERVCRLSGGALAAELGRALAEARSGTPLTQALQGVGERTSLLPLARFVDGVVIAMERGTPLAEVLRAQAVDVREAGKRALLESGGRKEIAMMVPVVFLVLPVTVLFALFPGLISIVRLAQ